MPVEVARLHEHAHGTRRGVVGGQGRWVALGPRHHDELPSPVERGLVVAAETGVTDLPLAASAAVASLPDAADAMLLRAWHARHVEADPVLHRAGLENAGLHTQDLEETAPVVLDLAPGDRRFGPALQHLFRAGREIESAQTQDVGEGVDRRRRREELPTRAPDQAAGLACHEVDLPTVRLEDGSVIAFQALQAH